MSGQTCSAWTKAGSPKPLRRLGSGKVRQSKPSLITIAMRSLRTMTCDRCRDGGRVANLANSPRAESVCTTISWYQPYPLKIELLTRLAGSALGGAKGFTRLRVGRLLEVRIYRQNLPISIKIASAFQNNPRHTSQKLRDINRRVSRRGDPRLHGFRFRPTIVMGLPFAAALGNYS